MDAAGLLSQIASVWERQIVLCRKRKHKDFGETADLTWKFLGQKYDEIYLHDSYVQDDGQIPFPEAPKGYRRPTLNLSQNFVALMLPYIHNRIPNRLVSPRRPELPPELMDAMSLIVNPQESGKDAMRAWLLQWWLNYLPQETGLAAECRKAATEGLVKGRGVVWHELVETAAGDIPGSFYDSVDNLLIDADAIQLRDAGFILRRRERSAWKVADEFQLDVKVLRADRQSNWYQAAADEKPDKPREGGDCCVYYEVFSRMGIGHKLVDAPSEVQSAYDLLESAGRYIYLAIMPGIGYPLNLPPDKLSAFSPAEVKARMSWPIELYGDFANPWPCSVLDFYPCCDNPWARSPLEAGIPHQVFMDYAYRFITNRVKATCRNLYVVSKEVDEEIVQKLASGLDQVIVRANTKNLDISKLIQIVTMPELNKELFTILQLVQREFEKVTGTDPLLYGSQPMSQDRSAAATRTREAHLTSRPDDFADTVEAWQTAISSKEAVASRLTTGPQIIASLVGEPITTPDAASMAPDIAAMAPAQVYGPLTQQWMDLIYCPDQPELASSDMQYTVEAGTGRKKNKQKQENDAQQLVQTLLAPLLQFGTASGNFGPYNALMAVLGEAMEFPMQRLMLPNAPPPQPQAQPPESPPEDANVPASVG